jgi:hypothetical protein
MVRMDHGVSVVKLVLLVLLVFPERVGQRVHGVQQER